MNLSLSQVFIKLPYRSQNIQLIYFEFLNKTRDPQVSGYPLIFLLNQTKGGGLRGGKLNDNTPIAHDTKEI